MLCLLGCMDPCCFAALIHDLACDRAGRASTIVHRTAARDDMLNVTSFR